MHLALVHSHGSSNPECDASSRTCGLHGGAALAAQGRAVREVVHATALPASIYTTPTRYRSSVTARLVVIPVIYNCSNPGLCGRKFLFLLPHIPTVVSKPVMSRYRFGYVHIEICIVSDRSMT